MTCTLHCILQFQLVESESWVVRPIFSDRSTAYMQRPHIITCMQSFMQSRVNNPRATKDGYDNYRIPLIVGACMYRFCLSSDNLRLCKKPMSPESVESTECCWTDIVNVNNILIHGIAWKMSYINQLNNYFILYIFCTNSFMLDGWLGCQLSPQLVNLQTDFKNAKNLTMHACMLCTSSLLMIVRFCTSLLQLPLL